MCTSTTQPERQDKTAAELLAGLLQRHLHIEHPIPASFVTSLIHSQWGRLAALAYEVHDKDRRRGARDRRRA